MNLYPRSTTFERIAGLVCLLHAIVPVAAAERLDRGAVAVPSPSGGVLIHWRLLADDPPDVGFNVYWVRDAHREQRLNDNPITDSCSFLHREGAARDNSNYLVERVDHRGSNSEKRSMAVVKTDEDARGVKGRFSSAQSALVPSDSGVLPYLRIKFQGQYPASKASLADLDGDGALDYVIKQPNQTTDPGVWVKSEDTFKVEAYRSDGTFLWRKDLGWNIEQGIWYSPMIVYDFDEDGKAEVVLKAAPMQQDFRGENGRVLAGPEWCCVLNGLTGEEITRVDWIARGNVKDWGDAVGNRASRHMLGLAYLDGRRPSLLVHRGTYTTMRVDAYNFTGKKLEKLWSWNGDHEEPPVRGQGLHGLAVADIDEDGKDEVVLGSAVLDHDGKLLWSTRLGHADACYIADIDPARPGLEIMYGIEPRQGSNAICLVEARTGKMIWGCPHPTQHAHSQGLLADIDPENPGMEFYMGEKQALDRWIYSARTGKLLSTEDLGTLAPTPVYWNADGIKLFVSRERLRRYKGQSVGGVPGRVLGAGDFLGDWREEIITTVPGELRIYATGVAAKSRRVCLREERTYRTATVMQASGYFYPPQVLKP